MYIIKIVNVFTAERSSKFPDFGCVCCTGCRDLLPCELMARPSNNMERRLDRLEDLENYILSLLAAIRGI